MALPTSPPRPPTHQPDSAMSMVGGWTPAHEARLVYVQGRLREAQKRWSEDQGEWIDEVHSLEDLKRKCLKAEKKLLQQEGGGGGRKGSLAALWRKRSAGGGGAKTTTTTTTTMTTVEVGKGEATTIEKIGDEEGEGTDDDDDDEEGQLSGEPPRRRLSTLLRRTISLSYNPAKNTDASGGGRRSTYDLGRTISEGDGGAVEVREKGG